MREECLPLHGLLIADPETRRNGGIRSPPLRKKVESKGITTTFLTLAKGTYHLYSSVGNDEDRGMSGTLAVK